jgi:hypothetical protein
MDLQEGQEQLAGTQVEIRQSYIALLLHVSIRTEHSDSHFSA